MWVSRNSLSFFLLSQTRPKLGYMLVFVCATVSTYGAPGFACCHCPRAHFVNWSKMSFPHCRPSRSKQKQIQTQWGIHTAKLNKTQLASSNTSQLVLLQDTHFYSVPLPAGFRLFSLSFYAFAITFWSATFEAPRGRRSFFLVEQTCLCKSPETTRKIRPCAESHRSVTFRQLRLSSAQRPWALIASLLGRENMVVASLPVNALVEKLSTTGI